MTSRIPDDDEYFVETRTGLWSVMLPFGKGWRMYREDPVIEYLQPWLPRWLGAFFLGIGVIAFASALWKSDYTAASLAGGYLVGLPVLSIRSTLETTFLQIDRGRLKADREGKIFAPISAARRHFLKAQTAQIGILIGACTFTGGVIAAVTS